MTVMSKAVLLKNLGYTDVLSASNVGPFVGIHLGEQVHLRRTSDRGYIETLDAPPLDDPKWIYVSLPHLKESLRFIEGDQVDLIVMTSGVLMLRGVNSVFDTELRVYTVSKAHSGFKVHHPGPEVARIEPGWLCGLNVRPFTLSMSPVVEGDRLVLATQGGIIVWQTAFNPELTASPREAFLKALVNSTDPIILTKEGWFSTQSDGMATFVASHNAVFPLPIPTAEGAVRMTEISTKRLIFALTSATRLAAPSSPITLAPRHGVIARNDFNQPIRFGLGELSPFVPLDLSQASAKTIADALSQAEGDEVTLYRLASAHDRLLFSLGNCLIQVQGGVSSWHP
jgi:hypothetical protein